MANLDKIKVGETTYDIQDSAARTEVAGKQEKLVSGTNLKTVNGESLLGSGNITTSTSGTRFYKHHITHNVGADGHCLLGAEGLNLTIVSTRQAKYVSNLAKETLNDIIIMISGEYNDYYNDEDHYQYPCLATFGAEGWEFAEYVIPQGGGNITLSKRSLPVLYDEDYNEVPLSDTVTEL